MSLPYENATSGGAALEDHRQVRQKVTDGLDRVEALKREEVRLKGRIKTARAKAEPVIDVRNREL